LLSQRNPARLGAIPMTDELLLDADAACRLLGGSRPINPATLYRGIKAGIFPRPVKIAPNIARWRKSELEAAIASRIAERDSGSHTAPRQESA
jgi:predicted DNA-binding transcriptional regulator AlpA